MEVIDLRTSERLASGDIARISKEQEESAHCIIDTGYLLLLTQIEAMQISALYTGERFKPKETGKDAKA